MVDGEDADRAFMRVALLHAARGMGRTSPNPLVGCVVVDREGVVVGTGYHERAGEPHAEVHALRAAGARARGATLYCTLEPCRHHGRTGPCVAPIVDAGITRVVAAMEDPHPLVAGRGLAFLRERGVDVTVGVRRDEAAHLNRAFLTAVRLGRPHVTTKVALSADGRVAEAPGRRTVLTSAPANRRVQVLRASSDAIAVGSGTVLVDDPLLTVRGVFRERPFVRVVFDRRLRVPPTARLFRTLADGPVLIVTCEQALDAHADRAAALRDRGAEVIPVRRGDIAAALLVLGEREIRSVLLEGGPAVHAAAWRAGLVDAVALFVTPRTVGEAGVPWELPAGFSVAGLARAQVVPLGPDVLIEGDVHGTH